MSFVHCHRDLNCKNDHIAFASETSILAEDLFRRIDAMPMRHERGTKPEKRHVSTLRYESYDDQSLGRLLHTKLSIAEVN
ncbi:hypothetical protein [Bradyrhizobium sp. SZCCHNR1015]|uniref:hypothetical protein n=1 Tax=Bradyrhizobium sp. SZCCHNR1015 TaxID=3057338 RepID=UPI00291633A4|nr:hypothetical protein [Bradyrhizobium sp. SZCCHNR1015]